MVFRSPVFCAPFITIAADFANDRSVSGNLAFHKQGKGNCGVAANLKESEIDGFR